MEGTKRLAAHPLADRLKRMVANPAAFDFFHALRLVDAAAEGLPRLGRGLRPRDEMVRLKHPPSLAFAASSVVDIKADATHDAIAVHSAFFGLTGPQGPLPTHLTEYVLQRKLHARDSSFADLLDVFHHRMLLLFYRAWADARVAISRDRADADSFGAQVAALCGWAGPGLAGRDTVGDDARRFFVGHLAARPIRPEAIGSVLATLLGVRVQLRDFVFRWLPIPRREQTRLGRQHRYSRLGVDALVGERRPTVDSRFDVVLGPMTRERYEALLPGTPGQRLLLDAVRTVVGDATCVIARYAMAAEEVPQSRLGGDMRLGWTTWLGPPGEAPAREDLAFSLLTYRGCAIPSH